MTAITNDDTPTARTANPPADAGGETAASRLQTPPPPRAGARRLLPLPTQDPAPGRAR
uniref:hypothetical protein n=1 Tax=Azospirillum argentinense TaxID=2970906 RepID=UPI001586C061|nr:hypothetical protein [Azospirillum argentinense]